VAVVGSTTVAVFEAYVERALAPALRPGRGDGDGPTSGAQGRACQGTDRRERLRAVVLAEGRGCELLFLPPYSPGLSPIE
jgi:hypothetical protein